MNLQKRIDKDERQILVIVLLECLIFPWIFLSKSAIACLSVLFTYLFFRIILNNKFSILIILNLFSLCPIEINNVDISSMMIWLFLVVRLCYLLELILEFKVIRKNQLWKTLICLLSFVCLYDIFINMSISPILNWPQRLLYLVVPFLIFLKTEFSIEFLFKYWDIVFLCTFSYLIAQWIGYYPYEELRQLQLAEITWVSEYVRLGGLTCNSLCLSVILLFEAVSIWSRFVLYGKLNYALLLMLVLSILLTISKTAILGLLLISLYGFYGNLKYQRGSKRLVIFITAIVLVFMFVRYFFLELFSDNLSRLDNAQNELGHRSAAFEGVFMLFLDNPFGVGENLIKLLDTKYRTSNWIVGFSTLDNFFLTFIGKYGIFSVLYIALYMYGFFYAYRMRKNNSLAFHCVCMFYLCLSFISFSFNWEAYASILSFVCVLSALLIKILQNNSIK